MEQREGSWVCYDEYLWWDWIWEKREKEKGGLDTEGKRKREGWIGLKLRNGLCVGVKKQNAGLTTRPSK